jgi:hypothetical protein
MSLRDGTFDATILTPGIVAAAGGLLLIGLGAALRTLQRIERILALRPMPRAAESAKTAEVVEAPDEPVRIPFAPKLSRESQPGVASRDVPKHKSPEAAVGTTKSSSAIPAMSSQAVDGANVDATAQRSSKNGSGAAGFRTELRLPSSLRRGSAGERQSEPALDVLWPKGPRPLRAVEAPATPIAQGSGVMPVQSQQTADASESKLDSSSVSVLKSGIVNGMPYTLYSDGSIEAQLPEGALRFGSIAELRNHIEQSA